LSWKSYKTGMGGLPPFPFSFFCLTIITGISCIARSYSNSSRDLYNKLVS
jgi:hypothetical protein